MCLVLLQAMEMRIEPAFVAAGVCLGDASKYAALARDGFDSLGELIAGKALDADVLVPMGIKRGHVGELVTAFEHFRNEQQRQTIFVLIKEGGQILWPEHAIGFGAVPNSQASSSFIGFLDQLAEGSPKLQRLTSRESVLQIRSFLSPNDRIWDGGQAVVGVVGLSAVGARRALPLDLKICARQDEKQRKCVSHEDSPVSRHPGTQARQNNERSSPWRAGRRE